MGNPDIHDHRNLPIVVAPAAWRAVQGRLSPQVSRRHAAGEPAPHAARRDGRPPRQLRRQHGRARRVGAALRCEMASRMAADSAAARGGRVAGVPGRVLSGAGRARSWTPSPRRRGRGSRGRCSAAPTSTPPSPTARRRCTGLPIATMSSCAVVDSRRRESGRGESLRRQAAVARREERHAAVIEPAACAPGPIRTPRARGPAKPR